MPDSPVALPYVPAAYLIANSLLTAPQLVSQFQDFRNNLQYVSVAPELVFERLVASLNELFTSAFKEERQEYAAALRVCDEERRILELSNEKLKTELAELKGKTPEGRYQGQNPIIGAFHTDEVPWEMPTKASKAIAFATPYSEAPSGLPMGLTMVDAPKSQTMRVRCSSSDLQSNGFKVSMDTWLGSRLTKGSCMWLEVAAGDPDFQFGTFGTSEDHSWTQPKFNTAHQVFFKRAYPIPPRVVVWFNTLDMIGSKDWRVKTYASNITPTGFTLYIETWGDTQLTGVRSTWVAYPADRPKVLSGSFNTLQVRPVTPPHNNTSGSENFGNVFDAPPRVLVALNMIDIDCRKHLRVGLRTSVGRAGMTWNIGSWDDSILYSAGASYIALG